MLWSQQTFERESQVRRPTCCVLIIQPSWRMRKRRAVGGCLPAAAIVFGRCNCTRDHQRSIVHYAKFMTRPISRTISGVGYRRYRRSGKESTQRRRDPLYMMLTFSASTVRPPSSVDQRQTSSQHRHILRYIYQTQSRAVKACARTSATLLDPWPYL
jgi:hypothetical protein